MIRLFFIAVFMMMLSGAGPVLAAGCMIPKEAPTLRVDIDASQPIIDHSKQRMALKRFDIATISPYGTEKNVHVNGLMRGAITLETQMGLAWQRLESGEDNCYWFNSINLHMKLNPTIFIAAEIPENTCLFQEVLKHEYQHYNVDLNIAKDYQLVFQEEIERFMRQTGMIGPFPASQQEQAKQELIKRLEALVQSVNDRMKVDRMGRQAKIDTREEYERVVKSCPHDRGSM